LIVLSRIVSWGPLTALTLTGIVAIYMLAFTVHQFGISQDWALVFFLSMGVSLATLLLDAKNFIQTLLITTKTLLSTAEAMILSIILLFILIVDGFDLLYNLKAYLLDMKARISKERFANTKLKLMSKGRESPSPPYHSVSGTAS